MGITMGEEGQEEREREVVKLLVREGKGGKEGRTWFGLWVQSCVGI